MMYIPQKTVDEIGKEIVNAAHVAIKKRGIRPQDIDGYVFGGHDIKVKITENAVAREQRMRKAEGLGK
jgi:hypothetical protein